jgi:hypothetical protein
VPRLDKRRKASNTALGVERVKGIEPSYAAWEAAVLPLNYTRSGAILRQFPDTVEISV